jgi:DNA-binding GntR family transcriptional regulator
MPQVIPRRKKRTREALPAESKRVDAEGKSLAEAVYQRLLEGIISGEFPTDAVLSEVAVARDFGVSRTPVHDALRLLARDGLVQRERNCRARVAGINPDDIFEIFEMRKLLEGPAAELAAGRMDRRHLSPLRSAANALRLKPKGADWTVQWAEFDDLFHSTIAEASGNRRLAHDINRYRLLHKGFNRLATEPEGLQSALAEHLGILEALEARDGALARERMVAHIVVWQDYFIRTVPSDPADSRRKHSA